MCHYVIYPFTGKVAWHSQENELNKFLLHSEALSVFWGQDRAQRVRCAISREALDDHFHGDDRNELEVFIENRPAIDDITRHKYLSGRVEPDGTVLIRTADIPH
jgi:hypothetical protein